MKNAVLYIHGKGGSAAECKRYKPLFPDCEASGLDYQTFTPWETGAEILYGSDDNLTSFEIIHDFAKKHDAGLTVMAHGEHWFHTEEQMRFLDEWIRECRSAVTIRRERVTPVEYIVCPLDGSDMHCGRTGHRAGGDQGGL